jgi:hypothetical protein
MAEALGLSKSWTERLRRRVRRYPAGPSFFFPAG